MDLPRQRTDRQPVAVHYDRSLVVTWRNRDQRGMVTTHNSG